MKRLGLIVASVVLVLPPGVLLARAAWTDSPAAGPAAAVTDADAVSGPAGWHYRHSQPTHWRACLLQP